MKASDKQDWSTQGLDVVYMCRTGRNEELVYSLRSICQNLKFNRVFIFGGKPDNIEPDVFVPLVQAGSTKWERVHNNFMAVAKEKRLTDDIILFNDDFFVMKPTDQLPPKYRCSMYEQIVSMEMKFGNTITAYTKQLRKCVSQLDEIGKGHLSYELHIPMIINRKKLYEILRKFPDGRATRTLYGNYAEIGGEQSQDFKINDSGDRISPDWQFVSTMDNTFAIESVYGSIIKAFPTPSRYEIVEKSHKKVD